MTAVQDYKPDAILSPLDVPDSDLSNPTVVSSTERGQQMLKILNDIFDRTECERADD